MRAFRAPIVHQLTKAEHADSAEIKRSQERRLRTLVRVAATYSPFYRQYFRESGIEPRSVQTLEDLPLLPLITRQHLVERPDDFCVYPRRLMWAARSTGTSGAPVTCYRTPGSSIFELCALERQWSWFGISASSRRVVLRGSDFAGDSGKFTKEVPGAHQLLVSSFHLVPQNLDAIMNDIRAFSPDAVEGWPSSIALLGAMLRERGEKLRVKGVITSSETMTPARIALIENVFGGPIIDHYGQTERALMAGACEYDGYHIFPDYGIAELLPIPGSESRWELVGSPLHNWGFPLFRYRTGDEVGPAPSEPCQCRRPFPHISRVHGRIEDSFTAVDGRPIPLPSTVVDSLSGVREAQIAQLGRGRFEVRVAPGAGFDRAALEEDVRLKVDRMFGVGQHVTLKEFQRIPRAAGGKLKSAVVEDVDGADTGR